MNTGMNRKGRPEQQEDTGEYKEALGKEKEPWELEESI